MPLRIWSNEQSRLSGGAIHGYKIIIASPEAVTMVNERWRERSIVWNKSLLIMDERKKRSLPQNHRLLPTSAARPFSMSCRHLYLLCDCLEWLTPSTHPDDGRSRRRHL